MEDSTISVNNDLGQDITDGGVILTSTAHSISNQEEGIEPNDLNYNEEYYSTNEEDDDYSSYVSVRDFAYDNDNPLYYGYLEEESATTDDDSDNVEYNDKRKSYTLPRDYIINKKGIALYDFKNLNDNELPLKKGDLIFINYKHGQGWLVVQRLDDSGEAGLVPEDYVEIVDNEDEVYPEDGSIEYQENPNLAHDMNALNIEE